MKHEGIMESTERSKLLEIPFSKAVKVNRPFFSYGFDGAGFENGKPVIKNGIDHWNEVYVCPDCVEHEQGPMNGPDAVCDCKVVFVNDGKSHGQCMCYSDVHGRREY